MTDGSPLAGTAIGQGDTLKNVQVLALKRRDGDILVSPGSDAIIEVGDALIVIGTDRQLEPLEGNE